MQPNKLSLLILAIRGAFWGTAMNVINQCVRFVVFVFLARLLGPEDFGLVALVMTLVILSDMVITNGGWKEALVRRDAPTETEYSSVFWLVLAVSLLLAFATGAGITVFSDALEQPEMTKLVYWLLPLYLFAGLRTIPQAILIRRFDYRSIALASNTATLVGGIVAITLAYNGAGVWALVANQLVLNCLFTILLLKRAGWLPKPRPTTKGLDGVRSFVPNAITVQIARYADFTLLRVFTGTRFGLESVGHYSISLDMRGFLRSILIMPASQVVIPSITSLKDQPDRLRDALAMGIGFLAMIVLPAAVGASLVAGDVIPLLLGPQWAPVIPLVEISMLSIPAIAFIRTSTRVQYAFGRAGIAASLAVASTCLLVFLLVVLPVNSVAAIVAITLARGYLVLPAHFLVVKRLTGLSISRMVSVIVPNVLATLVMAAGIMILQNAILADATPVLRLALSVVVGAVLFATSVLIISPGQAREVRRAAGELLRHRRVAGAGPEK